MISRVNYVTATRFYGEMNNESYCSRLFSGDEW